jgi:ribonuclease HII
MPAAEPARGAARRPDLGRELALLRRGQTPIAGLDEAGRGALAGPLFAAAVILPVERFDLASRLDDVRDSKALTDGQRRRWSEVIRSLALAWAVGEVSSREIDVLNPLEATRLAMQRALNGLPLRPTHVLIDHLLLPNLDCEQTPVTHGDACCLSIAAASVLAKVGRDQALERLDRAYPQYGFASHKGYGTPAHLRALRRWGPSPAHRLTFAPVAAAARRSPRAGLRPRPA